MRRSAPAKDEQDDEHNEEKHEKEDDEMDDFEHLLQLVGRAEDEPRRLAGHRRFDGKEREQRDEAEQRQLAEDGLDHRRKSSRRRLKDLVHRGLEEDRQQDDDRNQHNQRVARAVRERQLHPNFQLRLLRLASHLIELFDLCVDAFPPFPFLAAVRLIAVLPMDRRRFRARLAVLVLNPPNMRAKPAQARRIYSGTAASNRTSSAADGASGAGHSSDSDRTFNSALSTTMALPDPTSLDDLDTIGRTSTGDIISGLLFVSTGCKFTATFCGWAVTPVGANTSTTVSSNSARRAIFGRHPVAVAMRSPPPRIARIEKSVS